MATGLPDGENALVRVERYIQVVVDSVFRAKR
jgi:hypothetical protein